MEERPQTENMFQYNQESAVDKNTAQHGPSTNIYQLLDLRQITQPLWPQLPYDKIVKKKKKPKKLPSLEWWYEVWVQVYSKQGK